MPYVNVSLLRTLRVMGTLMQGLKKQERYFEAHLPALLRSISGNDTAFPPAAIKRTRQYWELALNVVCNSFYQLHNRQLSADEQYRILLLSVFAPLYADLFDKQLLDGAQLEAFTLRPALHDPASFEEQVAKAAYLQLLARVPDQDRFITHLHQVFQWQQTSLLQLADTVSERTLYDITYKKSYHSFLLYYAILDHYPSAEMQQMLYQAAGLLQLTNDAFDVYKDIHSGIYTLPNHYRDFDKLQQHFMYSVASFNEKLAVLPYAPTAKKFYCITMHTLHAMGYMALEQLKASTHPAHNLDELRSLSRQSLTLDMDSLQQKARCIWYVRRLANYHGQENRPVVRAASHAM